ncbi:hypothetical protein Enr13x_25150 [Stieleria neptunia]|uniref:Uncharacterized protein n=1 Tax=Stieleria neptunia TaxID=2527979 RepID=A0A518HP98_9BACT|nr:hypothetical protein Enr13x_25150 [Stieleria neptunia]
MGCQILQQDEDDCCEYAPQNVNVRLGRGGSSEWDRLPACHSSVDRLEAYPTYFAANIRPKNLSVRLGRGGSSSGGS